jgi:hypothetical protein
LKYTFENKVEFYITNVCNLTCENCNRFNNHKFTGWQRWSDYADTYRRWSEYIELKNIVILGGEPTLNPTLSEWVVGLNDIFKCNIQILSNGLQLNFNEKLYNALANIKSDNGMACGNIEISLHNQDHFDQIRSSVKSFLQPINEEYGTAINVAHKYNSDNHAYYSVRDVNNVLVRMHLANSFHDAAVYKNNQGQFTLHDSDPIEAHRGCGFAQYKCYHFIRGQLYKCGPVALMPEFDQQHNLAISAQDRLLLNSYQPLTVDHWPGPAVDWLARLDDPIAQCKFCPTITKQNITIYPTVKGSNAS